MKIGVPTETMPGERRVALIPDSMTALGKSGHELIVESGAGVSAGYPDDAYKAKGATIAADRAGVFGSADAVFQVRGLGANPSTGRADLELMKTGQVIVAMMDPLGEPEAIKELAARNVTAFAMEGQK